MIKPLDRIKPWSIRLEASTICQLRCAACPNARGKVHESLGAGFLKLADFKKIVDQNPWISDIELSNWGEIFLNPELADIIKYGYEKGVRLHADNGTNLNSASEETLEALVKYGFRSITCSIDGADQETYGIYRRNGKFDNVIANIKTINKYKEKYQSKYPKLTWQFVAFGHNEHAIANAKKMANALDMRFFCKLSWDDLYLDEVFSPVKNSELIKRECGLDVASREEYYKKHGNKYERRSCYMLWESPQVNNDGRILGCSLNYRVDLGNAFEEGLLDGINNEKCAYARAMLMGKAPPREDIPCTACEQFMSMREDNSWISATEIRKLALKNRIQKIRRWLS